MTVYFLGLDGASQGQLDEVLGRISLPNFWKLKHSGAIRPLKSVYPYVTAPGWASIFTGVNPGKHGIFDMYSVGKNGLIPSNIRNSKVPLLWDYLSWAGKRVLVAGVPFYHPAPSINGWFVTGRFAKGLSFTPPTISRDFDLSGFEYSKIERIQDMRAMQKKEAMEVMIADLKRRTGAALKLLDEQEWDAVILVDALPDELLHTDFDDSEMLDSAYLEFDSLVGTIMQRMKGEDVLVVASDHGFGRYDQVFYLNEWLEARGYVKKSKSVQEGALRKMGMDDTLLNREGMEADLARFIVRRFPSITKRLRKKASKVLASSTKGNPESKVYAFGTNTPVAWIRIKKGNEGIMDGLMSELDELRAKGILRNVFRTSELYKGQMVEKAIGQILLETTEDFIIDARRMNGGSQTGPRREWEGGCHKLNGMVATYPFRIENRGDDLTVYDIVPTILGKMGIPVPDNLDGKPMLGGAWGLKVT